MSLNRWQQIEEIFQSALDLAPTERINFVSMSCTGDFELQREVEKLLADYESADSFIESPVWTDSQFLNSRAKREIGSSFGENPAVDINQMAGRQVGVFELKNEIGRGGMGAVYLAERADGEFRQKVAVKLIKRGMDTDFIIRRFRNERQILASLNHPNIARLLDGGTTADGLPYFVMEFIEGKPIHQFCDDRKLTVRERLQIFGKVCEAIGYAHEQQIVHRDIKPGNILLTAQGVPKLLDFGIAKIFNPDLIHESINPTSTMMRLMTLEYASPEQVCGAEITPASDIYALGVLLYELLTGHRPYNFKGRGPHEISRIICEAPPMLPSAVVGRAENLLPLYHQNNVAVEEMLAMRKSRAEQLKTELEGGLDSIILKALCKEPAGRYASARDFLADISLFLDGKTVLAEPCAVPENAPKQIWSDSHPTGFKSIAVLPLKRLHVTGREETDDRFLGVGLADAMITRLSNIERFVVRPTSSVLRFGEGHFDSFTAGEELGVEFILDGHIQKVGERIRVSVQLLNVAERSTVWAQKFDEKITDVLSLEDAVSIKVAEALVPHLSVGERENLAKRGTSNAQAFEAYLRGRYYWNTFTEEGFAKAIVAYNEAIAYDPNYALAYAGVADYYNWLGVFEILPAQECFQAAQGAANKSIALDEELSEAHAALGFAVVAGKLDWAQGEKSCLRALELNPNNSTAHVWYSIQLFMEGRFEEGIKHARRSIKLDPLTPFNHHNLAWGLYFARRFDESIEEYQELTTKSPQYPLGFYGLSWSLRYLKRFDEAIAAVKRGLELSGESPFMLTCYGQTLAAAAKREEAREVLEKLEKLSDKHFISAYQTAIIYAFLGERETTLEKLEASFAGKEAWIVWLGVEPVFDFLKSEPRFKNLLERTGNPLFYRADTIVVKALKTDADVQTEPTKPFGAHNNKPAKSRYFYPAMLAAGVFGILIVIFFLGARFGWQKIVTKQPEVQKNSSSPERVKPTSVAVLPFVNTDAKNDNEQYLGVGTADLLTSKLSQINEINVRSASSVRRYLKTDKSPVEAGRELAVDYVVSGNIAQKNNRVTAKLLMTEISSGRAVWSDTFDEPQNNLLALQDSISERIANSLSLKLTSAEKQNLDKHFTENDEAQQLYIAGRFQFGKRTVEGLREAIALFDQAIKVDPNFALAYTGQADCYALLNWYQEPTPPDAWEQAKKAAEKAVALDDSLAEAHASLAFIKFHYQRDYRGSEDEFRRALNLKPNYATAHQWYAFLLSAAERHNESIAVMRRAEELEPRSAVIANAVANVLFHARMYDESIAQAKHSLEIDPSSVGAHVILRWNYEKKGMTDEALAIFEQEVAVAGDTPTSLAKRAHVLAAVGRKEESRQIVDELVRTNQSEKVTPYEIAVIYSLLDDRAKSLEWLKKAREGHAVGFSFVRVDPLLDNVRADKRFENLLP